MAEGREKDRAGNPEEEIGKYRAILDKDSRSRVFAPLAEAYRKAGLLDDAIDTAREGLTHHPSYLSGRVALARALFEKGEPDEARSEISQVVRSAPDNLMAHKLLGQLHLQGGNAEEAEKSFNMVLLLDPRDQEAQSALANLKPPPAHTSPPIESAALAVATEREDPLGETGLHAEEPAGAPAVKETLPQGLVFDGEEESPFDQSFDDMVEPSAPEEDEPGDPDEVHEVPFDLKDEDLEADEPAAGTADTVDPGDEPAAPADEVPFDLEDDDLEAVEPAADTADLADLVDEPAAPADEVPLDLGDEDLEADEPAADISDIADPGEEPAARADAVPFDLEDDDLEAVEPAADISDIADPGEDPAALADEVPFDLGDEDLEAVEPAAGIGDIADLVNEPAALADGVPFDLGDEDLEAVEPTPGAAVTEDDPGAGAENVPFDPAADDLETAAGTSSEEGGPAPEFEEIPSSGDDMFAEPTAADAVATDAADLPLAGAGETAATFAAPAAALPEPVEAEGDAFNTETLAHLYIKQGFYDKATGVYEAMLHDRPDDASLRQKLEESRSLAGMMTRAESPAAPAAAEMTAPRSPAPESTAAAAESDEHPAIVGLRRFLEQLKERQR